MVFHTKGGVPLAQDVGALVDSAMPAFPQLSFVSAPRALRQGSRENMPSQLEIQFHESMLTIYRKAKSEAKYNAQRFLQMVIDHGGLEAAHLLINSNHVSDGYVALWERGRLDLTVEAMILENDRYESLFSAKEREICRKRLEEYGYSL